MPIVNGWVDWATVIPGVPEKQYSQPNSGKWFACHSVVGKESPQADGVPDRFLSTEKGPDGRYTAYAAASCTFVLRLSGELIQMYPITASTWTSGGPEANTNAIAIEAEGGQFPNYSEPLTDEQVFILLCLWEEIQRHTGIKLRR